MLISNPLAEPLFLPVARTLAFMLAGGFAGVAAAVSYAKVKLTQSSLFIRWRTWAIIAPIGVLSVLGGSFPLSALVIAVAAACMKEFGRLVNLTKRQVIANQVLSGAMLVAVMLSPANAIAALMSALLGATVLAMRDPEQHKFESIAMSLLSLLYIPFLSSFALQIEALPNGAGALLTVIVASAVANIAAFCFGKVLGKHKLAPALSPNKTWEGAAGSMVGSAIAIGIMSFALPNLPALGVALLAVAIASAGIIGDLFESMLKRSAGTKDAGAWLPGFGGALDRVDGLLFVLPAAYFVIRFFQA